MDACSFQRQYRTVSSAVWLLFFGSLAWLAADVGFSQTISAEGLQPVKLVRLPCRPQSGDARLHRNCRGPSRRDLAPGVLTIIHPDQNAEDTAIGPADLDFVAKHPELAWSAPEFEKGGPNFASPSETLLEMGKKVTLRHPIWALEFSFKPVRMIEADVPNKSGMMDRKLVWYMVYRLRYIGGDLLPDLDQVVMVPELRKLRSREFSPRSVFCPVLPLSKLNPRSNEIRRFCRP